MERIYPDEVLSNLVRLINYTGPMGDRNLNAIDIILNNCTYNNTKYKSIVHDFLYKGMDISKLSKRHNKSEGRIREVLKQIFSRLYWDEVKVFIEEGIFENGYVEDFRIYKMCINYGINVFMTSEDRRNIRLSYIDIPQQTLYVPGRFPIYRVGELEDFIEEKGFDWWKSVSGLRGDIAKIIQKRVKQVPEKF